MKKEISPAITITLIAVIVLGIGFFAYRRIFTNPPVPTDHVDSFIRGTNKGAGASGAPSASGSATAQPSGQ